MSEDPTEKPENITKDILHFLSCLEAGDFDIQLDASVSYELSGILVSKLNSAMQKLQIQAEDHKQTRQNIVTATDAISQLAQHDFDIKLPSNTGNEIYDTFVRNLLGLRDELKISRERKELLKEALQKRDRLLENLQEAIFEVDHDGIIVYCNQAAERIIGRSKNEIVGKKGFELANARFTDGTPLQADNLPSVVVRKTGQPSPSRIVGFSNPNGRFIWSSLVGVPITWKDDQVKDILIVMTDLTEIESAKLQLHEEKNKLKRMFDGIAKVALVSLTDANGVILEVNDKFCKISGYSRDELIGQNHRIIKSGHHKPQFFEGMWVTIQNKRPWRGEVCNKAKDGTLYWVDSSIIPILDSKGNIENYYSIRYDISSRKTAEASLVRSTKLASMGEMAGGIAHEINNPVSIIGASADKILKLLTQESYDRVALEGYATSILETSKRITSIINGMHTLSRNADADPHTMIQLKELVDNVAILAQDRLKHHSVRISIDVPSDLVVMGNKTQLSQVLLNLIFNADDALRGKEESWIRVNANKTPTHIELSVTDSGNGIPQQVQQRLFVPFFTTKEAGKGTGLGLSLSRKILEQHKGELILDSSCPNTRFILKIPIQKL